MRSRLQGDLLLALHAASRSPLWMMMMISLMTTCEALGGVPGGLPFWALLVIVVVSV